MGFTGTIGFSVSVLGTGGQTRFSNLTVAAEAGVGARSERAGEVAAWPGELAPPSHIRFRLEIEPVLFLLLASASSSSC